MGISHVVRIANKFLELQRSLESTRKFWTDFLGIYGFTFSKIEAILKLRKKTWKEELAFKEDDHWLVETWRMDFEN